MGVVKYFIYSSEQLKLRKDIEEKLGKRFTVGHVIINGSKKPYTELSPTPNSRFSDAKIVAQGDVSLLKYTLPEGK